MALLEDINSLVNLELSTKIFTIAILAVFYLAYKNILYHSQLQHGLNIIMYQRTFKNKKTLYKTKTNIFFGRISFFSIVQVKIGFRTVDTPIKHAT